MTPLLTWLTSRSGASLRDLFAAEVLVGRLQAQPDADARDLAADVYEQADRLVAALKEAQSRARPEVRQRPRTE